MTNLEVLRLRTAVVAVCFAWCAIAGIGAAERRPLPPLALVSLDGQPVQVSDIAHQGNWLLLYVEPSCGSCASILSAMPAEEFPGMASRVTVIVGGATLEQAAALASASELSAAKWVLNPDRSARAALNIKQAPMTIGMRGTMIDWTLIGVLRRSTEMTSVLVSWLRQSPPPPPVGR
jgi:hypothetical protein